MDESEKLERFIEGERVKASTIANKAFFNEQEKNVRRENLKKAKE